MFDDVYKKDGVYFGLEPSEELVELIDTSDVPRGRALDLGCGGGRDSLFLARRGFQVLAIDMSPHAIAKLKTIADNFHLNVECIVADIRMCKFPSEEFVLVSATTLLDHVDPPDAIDLIKQIKKCLRHGGYVFAEVFTVEDPGYRQLRNLASECSNHVRHYYEKGELRDLFSDFTVLRYDEKVEWDTSHGKPHIHGIAVLIAQKTC